jgi:hypothetical protein
MQSIHDESALQRVVAELGLSEVHVGRVWRQLHKQGVRRLQDLKELPVVRRHSTAF